MQTLLWIWDNVFANGPEVIFVVALTIILFSKSALLSSFGEAEDALQCIQTTVAQLHDVNTFARAYVYMANSLKEKDVDIAALRQRMFFSRTTTPFLDKKLEINFHIHSEDLTQSLSYIFYRFSSRFERSSSSYVRCEGPNCVAQSTEKFVVGLRDSEDNAPGVCMGN